MSNATLPDSNNKEMFFIDRAKKLITYLTDFIQTDKSINFPKDLEKIDPNFNLFNDKASIAYIDRQDKESEPSQIIFFLYHCAEREFVASKARLNRKNAEKWRELVKILDIACDLVEEKVSTTNDDYYLIY